MATIVRLGLVPVTMGLVIASGMVMARAADTGWQAAALTIAAAAIILRTRLNPMWLLLAGGLSAPRSLVIPTINNLPAPMINSPPQLVFTRPKSGTEVSCSSDPRAASLCLNSAHRERQDEKPVFALQFRRVRGCHERCCGFVGKTEAGRDRSRVDPGARQRATGSRHPSRLGAPARIGGEPGSAAVAISLLPTKPQHRS